MSSGSGATSDLEMLLKRALAPVEPPDHLVERLESTLVSLTEMAADELEAWELSAMRDPRNWVRPAAAAVVGASAGTALVVLRMRAGQRRRLAQSQNLRDLTRRTVRDLAQEARRIV
jgi:hypothetical protein